MHMTALASCLLMFPFAVPDILPEGMRGAGLEVRVDAAALIDNCCVQYVVAAGDTFFAIAKHQLGDEKRAQAIVDLNDGIDPVLLQVGQRIWLPPKNAAVQARTFVFLETQAPFGGRGRPFVPSEKVPTPRAGELAFVLVPKESMTAFGAAQQKGWDAVRTLADERKLELVVGQGSSRLVQEGSPVRKTRDTYFVERDDKGAYRLRVETVRYDRDGKVLGAGARAEPERKEGLLLLLLAAGGGGMLLLRARQNRRLGAIAAA